MEVQGTLFMRGGLFLSPIFSMLPPPLGCSTEQLEAAYRRMYKMPAAELTANYQWCIRMLSFLGQSGRDNIGEQMANVGMFRDMTMKAMRAKQNLDTLETETA